MISHEEAYAIIIENAFETGTERVDFDKSAGRVLAEDIFSDMNMPPFNKSAMDGFACRMADIKNELEIIETIPAGKAPEKKIRINQCSRIMTGAKIPDGADCVLMVEYVEIIDENKIIFQKENTKTNICYLGEDVKTNDIVLTKGSVIKPQHIAVMASVGCTKPLVAKQALVGILSTGNEIIEPDKIPGNSQIRNSNGYQLIAQIERVNAIPNYIGIVEDSEKATYNAIRNAIKTNDIVLLTGGVSMGDFDFVPKIMSQLGINIKFSEIAVQPGKPTTFGIHDDALIFGLPGNPVSSYIQFELLVKPLIYQMMGHDFITVGLKLPMAVSYKRKKSERESWIPVIITDNGEVKPVEYHGSAHIYSLQQADGIIAIPVGITTLNIGDFVHVRQI